MDGAVVTPTLNVRNEIKILVCNASAWLQRKLCSSGIQSQPTATHALVGLLAARALPTTKKLSINQRYPPRDAN